MKHNLKVQFMDIDEATNKQASAIDIRKRNFEAIDSNPRFFADPQHLKKVGQVQAIVDKFFKIKKGIYIGHRMNKGKPFTYVKVDSPNWPNTLSSKTKQELYYGPLEELGTEIKSTRQGVIHRVF